MIYQDRFYSRYSMESELPRYLFLEWGYGIIVKTIYRFPSLRSSAARNSENIWSDVEEQYIHCEE